MAERLIHCKDNTLATTMAREEAQKTKFRRRMSVSVCFAPIRCPLRCWCPRRPCVQCPREGVWWPHGPIWPVGPMQPLEESSLPSSHVSCQMLHVMCLRDEYCHNYFGGGGDGQRLRTPETTK